MLNFGTTEVAEQQELAKFPQGAASDWTAFNAPMIGINIERIF